MSTNLTPTTTPTTPTTPTARASGVRKRRGTGPALLLAAGLTTLSALAGCSGGGSESASDASAETGELVGPTSEELPDAPNAARSVDGLGSTTEEAAGSAAADTDSATDSATGSDDLTDVADQVAVEGGLYIRTGRVTVVSDDLDAARASVQRTVQRYGGQVANEQTDNEKNGDIRSSHLTLRVPSARFSTVMASFAELGDVQGSQTEQEEVTTEVIDVASRIRTQEVSLERLRGFLDEATSVPSVIRLESEIARREADLASLRAQQDYLADQTSLSTIDLTLRAEEPEPKPAPEDDELEDAGFLAGLSGGWNALLDVLVVAATVLGALLPFAFVVALVGLPLAVWLRASRRQRRTTPTSQPAA